MSSNDIYIKKYGEFYSVWYGGGSLIVHCDQCDRDICSNEVGFPGSREQIEKCIDKMSEKINSHTKSTQH